MYHVYALNMLSTRVNSPIISILFYFCVIEVKYRKQKLSFKPIVEQSISMKLPVCYNLKIIISFDWSHLFSHPTHSPMTRFVKFFSINPCFYLRINTFSVVCVYPVCVGVCGCVWGGGAGEYINMKLVYMCRTGFKNGRLRERPLTENQGLSERPLTGKTGDFGVKNNKETYFFFSNEGLFDLPRS